MMAGVAEDVRALFGAAVRAALEAWPALQVSGAAVDGGWNVSGPAGGDRRSTETLMSEDRNGRITYPLWPTESARRPLGRFTGR